MRNMKVCNDGMIETKLHFELPNIFNSDDAIRELKKKTKPLKSWSWRMKETEISNLMLYMILVSDTEQILQ